jgi:hypothetical protein
MDEKPVKFAFYDTNTHVICPKEPTTYAWKEKDGSVIVEDAKTGKRTRMILP